MSNIATNPLFINAPLLRQYDHYPLDCIHYGFSFHLCRVLGASYRGKWSPARTDVFNTEIKFSCTEGDFRQKYLKELFLGSEQEAMAQVETEMQFPELLGWASQHPDTGDCCPLDAGMNLCRKSLRATTEQSIGGKDSVSVWINGNTRLSVLAFLLTTCVPPQEFKRVEDLPALLVIFLAHLDAAVVQHHLHFWPLNGIPPHLTAGVLFGLSGAAVVESNNSVQEMGLLLAIYIYIWDILVKKRAQPRYCDGLLFRVVNELFGSSWTSGKIEKPKEVILANTHLYSHLSAEIRSIKAVVENGAEPGLALRQALQAGAVYEKMLADEKLAPLVRDQERVWTGRNFTRLPDEQHMKTLLMAHDGPIEIFNAFLQQQQKLVFLVIHGTNAESVQAGLVHGLAIPEVFVAQIANANDKYPVDTLLAMSMQDFTTYTRFASYGLTGEKWSPYAYSAIICQLWSCSDSLAQAVLLIRRMCNLVITKPASLEPEDVQRVRSLWGEWALQYEPPQLAAILPTLLAFNPDDTFQGVGFTELGQMAKEFGCKTEFKSGSPWSFVMTCAQEIKDPAKRLSYLMCYHSKGQGWPEVPEVVAKQPKSESCRHPFSRWMLKTQQDRAIGSLCTSMTECNMSEQVERLWQTLAILEQKFINKPVLYSPVVSLVGAHGPFGGHVCLKQFDFPFARDNKKAAELYCGRELFPCYPLKAQLLVPDRFRTLRSAFKKKIRLLKPLQFEPCSIVWRSRTEEILQDLQSVLPKGRGDEKPVEQATKGKEEKATPMEQDPVPMEQEKSRPMSPQKDPRKRPAPQEDKPSSESNKKPKINGFTFREVTLEYNYGSHAAV